jgi:DNA topoisomerase III
MRERLKEAKGIGTPATRAEIIKGLKRQNLLAADGKLVVPTEAGLQLFELLRGAAPALVDPGTTAEWEMQLDAVVTGRAEFKTVIDGIAAEADKLIVVLQQRSGGAVRLDAPAPRAGRTPRRPRGPRRSAKEAGEVKASPRRRSAKPKNKAPKGPSNPRSTSSKGTTSRGSAPTARMLAYAQKLAKTRNLALPPGYEQDFDACRRFLDQHG